jgi:hypothetical protein
MAISALFRKRLVHGTLIGRLLSPSIDTVLLPTGLWFLNKGRRN